MGGTTKALPLGYSAASGGGADRYQAGRLDGSFDQDSQVRIDYGYGSHGTLTPRARQVIPRIAALPRAVLPRLANSKGAIEPYSRKAGASAAIRGITTTAF